MMGDLLLEIGTEELPASYVAPALEHLAKGAKLLLEELHLGFEDVQVEGTPRRLALMVTGVSEVQPNREEEVTGPKVEIAFDAEGKLSKAGAGFLRGRGIDEGDAFQKETSKGKVIAAVVKEKGQPALQVLPTALLALMRKIPFQKTMRWGDDKATFARPVQWLLALFGKEVLDIEFAGNKANNLTFGHRFHSPLAVQVDSLSSWKKALEEGNVMLSFADRRQLIEEQSAVLAQKVGGKVLQDDALLDVVANLVERPWPILGSFEEAFLEIPKEILISEMREHQKYFAVVDDNENLMANFIVVAGSKATDEAKVAIGNARVLRSRFEDGAFYFKEDKKKSLTEHAGQLATVLFQRDLGTLAEKVTRIESLTAALCKAVEASDDVKTHALAAAKLCKADLVTGVVGEFPDLQGVMGRTYAMLEGLPEAVAFAIEGHYCPRHSGADLPANLEGALVGLADRADTLVSITAIGKAPSTGGDPFALRRAAISFATLSMAKTLRFSVRDLVSVAVSNLEAKQLKTSGAALLEEVLGFIRSRLRAVLSERLREAGFEPSTDVMDAAIGAGWDDLPDLDARAWALSEFRAQDVSGFEATAGVFKRVANILRQAREKGIDASLGEVDAQHFEHPAEGVLHEAIAATSARLQEGSHAALQSKHLKTLTDIAELKAPLAEFFDNGPMVMADDDDKRQNRLRILAQVEAMLVAIADFTRIQVEGAKSDGK